MNLYEYQAKDLFLKYDLPILQGKVCSNLQEIENFLSHKKGPWAIKCQVLSGGRGRAGGIKIVSSIQQALSFSKKWFSNRLITCQTTDVGELVTQILIEPAVEIVHEYYLGMLIDKNLSKIICIASAQGGVDIEDISKDNPDLIYKIVLDPVIGVYPYQGRALACKLGFSGIKIHEFSKIIEKMTRMFLEKDLMLIEINPLVITNNDIFLCLDAKVVIDQNAMFRQLSWLQAYISNKKNMTLFNNELLSMNYIPLEKGNIGCVVNGAGLAMATMDLINSSGGMPANFLDIGGDVRSDQVVSAFHMLLKNKKIKAILVNIFGGIICCEMIANSLIIAVSMYLQHVPIIVRLVGNNSQSGIKRLIDSKLNIYINNNLIHAIQQVVTTVKNNVNFN